MKIYFAGSIRGGRDDKELYLQIINLLRTFGTVLTEHLGDAALSELGEDGPTEESIYGRDLAWLKSADVVVAEATTVSLGVGYEIGQAEAMGKKIICLYRPQENKKLSAMIAGNKNLTVREYQTIEELEEVFKQEL